MNSSVVASVCWVGFGKQSHVEASCCLAMLLKSMDDQCFYPDNFKNQTFCFCCAPKWKHLSERGDNGQLIKIPNRQRFPFTKLGIIFSGIPLRNWHTINLNKHHICSKTQLYQWMEAFWIRGPY